MSQESAIEWTDATWNPVRGCTKVSPGCAHCYAETFAERFRGVQGHPYEQGFDLRLVPEKLEEPLKWKEPRRIFVNSMSDLFQDGVPDQFITDVFGIMALAYWHTFQVLTKRPDRMLQYLVAGDHGIRQQLVALQINGGIATRRVFQALDRRRRDTENEWPWPLPNVQLGVSGENRHWLFKRMMSLKDTPAAMRFVSLEPLLEDVSAELKTWLFPEFLNWVIVGGESGAGARPFNLAWARSIVAQCREAGVPVFVKQLGAKPYSDDDMRAFPTGDKKGGDMAEWPEDLRIREFPRASDQPGNNG
jgi:protein gp37